jgi:hypothetical protein
LPEARITVEMKCAETTGATSGERRCPKREARALGVGCLASALRLSRAAELV